MATRKTALGQILKQKNIDLNVLISKNNKQPGGYTAMIRQCRKDIKLIRKLLSVEMEQLIEAYEQGDKNGIGTEFGAQDILAIQWFNETYGAYEP